MTLREQIEEEARVGDPLWDVLNRAVVLRIIDQHEKEDAALREAAVNMARRTYVEEDGLLAYVPYDSIYALRQALYGSDENIIAALDAQDAED